MYDDRAASIADAPTPAIVFTTDWVRISPGEHRRFVATGRAFRIWMVKQAMWLVVMVGLMLAGAAPTMLVIVVAFTVLVAWGQLAVPEPLKQPHQWTFYADGTFAYRSRSQFNGSFVLASGLRTVPGTGRALRVGTRELLIPERGLPPGGGEWIDRMEAWAATRRVGPAPDPYVAYSSDPWTTLPFAYGVRVSPVQVVSLLLAGGLIGYVIGSASGAPTWVQVGLTVAIPVIWSGRFVYAVVRAQQRPRDNVIRITSNGLLISSAYGASDVPFDEVSKVKGVQSGLAFTVELQHVLVPAGAFRDREQQRTFVDLLSMRAGTGSPPDGGR